MRPLLLALSALLLASACGESSEKKTESEPTPEPDPPYVPPPESCQAPDLANLRTFVPCSTGGGIFGEWQLDEQGLPSYFYGLDQNADERAAFDNTEKDAEGEMLDRRDHWAAFGNRRVNAMLFNDGYVEVVTQDRGVEYLNELDEADGNHAGGFSYLDDGSKTWSTAYKHRPPGSKTTRRFGMGYGETGTTYRDVRVTRVTSAPPGDAPVVISDVRIENLSEASKTLLHYEYWDVGRRPIEINWLVSGKDFVLAPQTARNLRDERNGMFQETASYDSATQSLSVRRRFVGDEPRPPATEPSAVDYYANDPFLRMTLGTPSEVYVDEEAFFGQGGVAAPDAVTGRVAGAGSGELASVNGLGQPLALVMKSELDLGPGETATLRFVYGYAKSGDPLPEAGEWSDPGYVTREAYAEFLRERMFYFAGANDPFLHREMAWHSYQVETSVSYRDYWQGHVVPQGSAYLYLHGADGAARDLGLFAVPLVYTDPALAKEELNLFMGIQFAEDDRFSYAFQGHGMTDDAGIHSAPSDLPINFAWALSEYLSATGDLGYLDEVVPFYPREARPDATVYEHLTGAIRHLFDVIGTGEHGLIRVQTGDWSDGIVVAAPDRQLAEADGESIPNTQMAVAVLPRVADLIEPRDAALATEIRGKVDEYRAALVGQWNGEFFYRAYYGDGVPVDADSINLESQIWALIGDTFAAPGDRQILIDKIYEKLDGNSPTGGTLWPGGQVWPAISGPLTWGYALSHPQRAWDHLARNTMAAHAQAFPEVWYGIWSGPDGASSKSGRAWASQVTPMQDFPVQNNNQHSMPILAALRVAGVYATAEGLLIDPAVPGRRFAMATQLVDLEQDGATISGTYRPTGTAARVVEVRAPDGETVQSASLDGQAVPVTAGATSVRLDVAGAGAHPFQVTTGP